MELDRARIEGFLARAADRLPGEWLLVGGAAAAIWFAVDRSTDDIDLVGSEGSNAERLRLLELAEEEGLPIEALNSAADYFVRRIPRWDQDRVLLRSGAAGKIYRPTATMFLLLKIARLSEQDLDDCLALLDWCRSSGEEVDRARVRHALGLLPPTADAALAARRAELDTVLESWQSLRR